MTGNCIICGNEFKTYPCLLKRKKYCSIICRKKDQIKNLQKGKKYRFKKGQIPHNKKGFSIKKCKSNKKYKLIFMPDHPFSTKRGYVREHRLVAESYLGRYLTKEEVVHHIDNNGLNNDINNLQVMTNSEHSRLHVKNNLQKFFIK